MATKNPVSQRRISAEVVENRPNYIGSFGTFGRSGVRDASNGPNVPNDPNVPNVPNDYAVKL
jgi:hypothetical protein